MSNATTATKDRTGPRARPPFRADHVGSLLRPPALAEARAAHKAGTLSAEALRDVEDRCIAAAIRRQEELGLRAATDGEYRRAYWHFDFVAGLDGVELYEPAEKIRFKGGIPLPLALRVTDRIGFGRPVMVEDYRFVARQVRGAVAKMTIPSPSVVHFRGGRRAIDAGTYPDMDGFFADLAEAYNKAVRGVRRGGLPLSAARRGQHRLSVRPGADRGAEGARRTCREPAADLCRAAEPRDRGAAGRHGDQHASLPRQFPLHLGRVRRLRAGGRGAVQPDQRRCVFHGVRQRPRRRVRAAALRAARATRWWCWGWSPASPASWRARTS